MLLVPPHPGNYATPEPKLSDLPSSTPAKFLRQYSTHETREASVQGLSTSPVRIFSHNVFYVGVPCVPGDCGDLYVLFEGPAIFTPLNITRNATVAKVEYAAADSGRYDVHIELQQYLDVPGPEGTSTWGRIRGSPFSLMVLEPKAADAASSLLHISKVACPDLGWRTGRWLPCHEWEAGCLRGGWVWAPHSCHFNTYSPAQLLEVQEPLWIVLAGTSVQRGTFFSFVDMILGDRAANLTDSSFWKCW